MPSLIGSGANQRSHRLAIASLLQAQGQGVYGSLHNQRSRRLAMAGLLQTQSQSVYGSLRNLRNRRKAIAELDRVQTIVLNPATDIPGLVAWYDPTDTASVTLASGKVSQINDKSASGFHLTQATGANQPTYRVNFLNGKSVIEFLAASSTCLQTASAVLNSGAYTVCTMGYLRNTATASARLFTFTVGLASTDTGTTAFLPDRRDGSQANITTLADSNGANAIISNLPGYNTWFLHSTDRNPTLLRGSVYGGAFGTRVLSVALGGTINRIIAGSSYSGSAFNLFWDGYWGGSMVYQGVLSDANRQKAEGWLAWNLGLSSSLDAAHPYRYVAP